uniref:Uncharacterized protein n=1 Tax=Amphimedon queenslandica TaxID=400682 RepID=A0A1X7UB64_AMPQE
MTTQHFDALLCLVGPSITQTATKMRDPVLPGERLAITIRYLTTGDAMRTITFSYCKGHSTLAAITRDKYARNCGTCSQKHIYMYSYYS